MKILYSSVPSINLSKISRRNGHLCQKLKPIIIERASYSIQFEIGTKTVNSLKFNKFSQSGEQIIIDFSESRAIESKRIGEIWKRIGYVLVTCEKKVRVFI